MPKDLTKYHPQPCANCGHRDMHGEVGGCIAMASINPDRWCDCTTYVSPRDRARDAADGRRRGAEGAEQAAASHAMTVGPDGPTWRAAAEARLDELIATGQEFTAEDVTDVVGVAPSPSAIGSLFKARAFLDRAIQVGWTTATRPAAHGRPLRVWRAKAAEAVA